MITIEQLKFSYNQNIVINIDTLKIQKNEHLFIEGASGSGKSTLLSLMAGVLSPDTGTIRVLNTELTRLKDSQKDLFRAEHIGFIFQQFNLIPYLSVIENVTLPCRFSDTRKRKALGRSGTLEKEAIRLLRRLGLEDTHLLSRSVNTLSVGQEQRVAAARAMIGSPEIIIADEPTSALDNNHRQAFMQTLFDECVNDDITLIFVSHDTSLKYLFTHSIDLVKLNNVPFEEAL